MITDPNHLSKDQLLAQGWIEKYGCMWPKSKQDPAIIEQAMFLGKNGEHKASGFGGPNKEGVKFHFKESITLLFSHDRCSQPFEWNPNALLMLDEYFLTGGIWTMYSGHGSSSKTRCSACFKTQDYLMDPENTSCLFTSTTMPDGKRRVWADVERFWFDACTYFGGEERMPGELVHSVAIIRYIDRANGRIDEARGMALIPSGNDEEAKAGIGKMIGYKAPRMRIGLDEASHVSWKVVECIESNLMTGCNDTPFGKDMKVTVTLNPNVKTDTGGKLCCPVDANGKEDWKAVDTTTSSRWKNKRGNTIRLSGYDSPNVKLAREGKCAPHDQPWSGLLSLQLYEDQKERLPVSSFQRQYDAIWPEGEAIETIFTDDEVRHHRGHVPCEQKKEIVASLYGLDPAWTHDGDGAPLLNCILVRDQSDRLILEYKGLERMDDGVDPTKDFVLQLEAKVASRLTSLRVKGKDFGMDVTGGGRNVYSHVMEKWHGTGSLDVVFNASPTDKPVSALDKTPANERYTDLMTEMWMFLKELLMSGQLKNLPENIIEQLCARRYGEGSGRDKKGRIILEENRKTKKRFGKGTDEANALAVCAHVAKMHYGLVPDAKPASAPLPEPKNPIMEMFKFDSLAKAPNGSFKAKMRRFVSLLSGPPRIE